MLKPTVASLDMPRLVRWITEDNAEWLHRGLETRRRINREDRFFDVHFHEFQNDPIDVVTRLYAHFGFPLDEDALTRMKNFMANNPRGKHGLHEYSFDDYGLDRAQERERYAAYQEHFGVASEI